MRKKRVIFVQGYGDYADGGWPSWLGRELTKYGFEFNMLSMPDGMYPEVFQWLDYLAKQVINIDEDTYFVGHSLGCITIARFLEKTPKKSVAGGCIFVSGFCTLPKLPLLSDFCTLPLNFSEVKKRAKEFVMIASDNDRIIPRIYSEEMAEKLGARMIIEPRKGHFMVGVKEVFSVLNSILEMDQMKEEKRVLKRLSPKLKV